MTNHDDSAYTAAYQTAAFHLLPEAGFLSIGGEDRAAFLQRQTTNDVRLLEPKRALPTVLTSPTARILDVFYLLHEPETIGVITIPGQGAQTARFLKSRIFFMDKVTVEDASLAFVQIELLGPQAGEVLTRLGAEHIPGPDEIVLAPAGDPAGDAQVRVLNMGRAFGLGYRLLAPATAGSALEAALLGQGTACLDSQDYQWLRVEAGLPEAGRELTEAYTPLETGLKAAVSDSKGCYTGQEIIARQVTYDKVTQQLCGLRLEVPAQPGERVWVEGKAVGQVTSAVDSPRLGPVALAILKRPHFLPGTAVQVGSQVEGSFAAVVSSLPFIKV